MFTDKKWAIKNKKSFNHPVGTVTLPNHTKKVLVVVLGMPVQRIIFVC